MEVGQIITLLSGAGIGAVLSAFLVFINNSKKNKLDFVTKERSEWRREIKSIIVDLLSGNNRNSAINRLKTQLNPYGRNIEENNYEFYMNDGHIWKLLDNFDYSSKNVIILTKYLELLLKYDWERSKNEVIFDYQTLIIKLFRFFLLLFTIYSFLTLSLDNYSIPKDCILLRDVLRILLVLVIFPAIIYLIIKQQEYVEILIKNKSVRNKKNNMLLYAAIYFPLIWFILHFFIFSQQFINIETFFPITAKHLMNRLFILLLVPMFLLVKNHIKKAKKNNEEYIKNIVKIKEHTHV
ncbi:hypothetical protein D8819_07895 [Streptococcus gordonii]|uniref:hypothetical protein n=1 Tax=Streptococcus gordonii TaxID=1302 RepID=UPI000F66C9D2|nr:hypothetical protein [Streptococcus gordonii]RSJ41154.1 hypothetical protein D8819_07895 [Streptococcus gordonii]